jgi:hypothetical protein
LFALLCFVCFLVLTSWLIYDDSSPSTVPTCSQRRSPSSTISVLHIFNQNVIWAPLCDQMGTTPYTLHFICYVLQLGPGNVVGIATAYGLGGPGIESRWGRDFLHLSRPALRPTQPPVKWVPGLFRR